MKPGFYWIEDKTSNTGQEVARYSNGAFCTTRTECYEIVTLTSAMVNVLAGPLEILVEQQVVEKINKVVNLRDQLQWMLEELSHALGRKVDLKEFEELSGEMTIKDALRFVKKLEDSRHAR